MKTLLKLKIAPIFLLILIFAFDAEARRKKLPYETQDDPPVNLSYTHLLPSTSVIPAGTLVIGTSLGIGIFDIFDVSTNLFLDLAQDFNISGKVHLWRDNVFGLAAFVSYASQSISTTDPISQLVTTTTYSAISPGAVVSYYIFPQFTGHTGYTATIRSGTPTLTKANFVPRNGYVQGNYGSQEFTYGINRTVALSAGVSYDFSYDITGAGASVHIGGFQIGAHYYFNVAAGSILPILGGSYSVNY